MKKKVKVAVVMLFVAVSLFSFGCGKKAVDSANISRDDARVGGSLSFVYNKDKREAYIGGEGEVVQYSLANDTLGFDEGCRVGLKITAPDGEIDLETASLKMNGVRYAMGDFLAKVNGEPQRFFTIYPKFSKEDKSVNLCISWGDKVKKQEYKVIIEDGTQFMDKDGNVA